MTNFEFYKDEIMKIIAHDDGIAISKTSGKPIPCESVCYCENECELDGRDCDGVDLFKWLYAEYVEKPKLTLRERKFCELALTGYITRDEDGLFYFSNRPKKREAPFGWEWVMELGHCVSLAKLFPDVKFDFIKSTDEEPWNIEDLLKLEVI